MPGEVSRKQDIRKEVKADGYITLGLKKAILKLTVTNCNY